ncbi:uncharacterized protein LOC143276942 isoform X2 [Babylonia areolata]
MDSCPMVSRHKLPASTSETVYSKDYIYDPLSSSWHSDNGVSITKVRAVCDWEVRADRADHTLWVTVTLSAPSMAYSLLPGDCWTVHDGSSSSFARLGRECEGMGMEEVRYNSSGRSLYLVFTQGEKTGRRTIQFRYRVVRPDTAEVSVQRVAGIVSGVIAALGVFFLLLKFTRCCRPCCKKCCPQCVADTGTTGEQVEEEGAVFSSTQRLHDHDRRPATPTAPPPERDGFHSLVSTTRRFPSTTWEENPGFEPSTAPGPPLPPPPPGGCGGNDANPLPAFPPEPPPAYESIFGESTI